MAQKILFTFSAQDVGVAAAQDAIKDRQKAINAEIKAAKALGSPYTQLLGESVKLKRETEALREQQKLLNREFKTTTVPKDSLAGLRLEYQKLSVELSKLTAAERGSNFGKGIIKNAAQVKQQIDGIEQSIGRFTGNVGNYKTALLSIGDLVTGGLVTGGIFALASGLKSLGERAVRVNAQISDAVADVAKTANVSIEAIERLSDRLEKRDTRTSLVDQLGIAKIGGQLGVAEKDLFNFVDAVDVVNVALGDQFGGSVEATTDVIGKLRNVLLDVKTDNVGNDIVHIGNALNFLEAQGVAGAESIADFAGRIGGIGSTIGVSSGKILGVSTTLAELGVNAERGSTGFIKLLQRVSQSPDEFAKAAGISADEFKKVVNNDIFGAVELFLGKINDKGLSNTELAQTMKTLKLSGVGVTEVVSKLGGNLGLLSTRVGEATKTLTENSSVMQEFEKKNVTLGAQIEKLGNAFDNLLTSSAIGRGLANLVGGFVDLTNAIADGSNKLFDWGAASTGAETANAILEKSFQNLTGEIYRDSVATETNFNILRDGRATQQQRQSAIEDLVKLYPDLLTQQQLEAGNIEQLNGLQALATSTLRTQITERIKLRAKEGIETEIITKKLRQIQLDATPDRALLGELTAGETIRNFGVLDPKKLRGNLSGQFTNDIAELEAASAKVDQNFRRLAVSAEDNLTSAQQDALDLFRQFNEGGATATKNLEKTGKGVEDLGDKVGGGKSKDKKKALAGSLDAAKEALAKLNKEIDATPTNSPQLQGLIDKAGAAQKQVQFLEEKLENLRNPKTPLTDDQRALQDFGFPDPDEAIRQAKEARDKIGAALGQQITGPDSGILGADEERLAEIRRKLDQDQSQQRIKDEENEAERRKSIKKAAFQQALDSAQAIADGVFGIKQAEIDRELNAELSALDKKEQTAIDAAGGNAVKEKAIRADFEKQRAELERQAARKRKELSRKEALVNIALSITKALTGAPFPFNLILAAGAAIAGAVQLSAINAQEFAGGGAVKQLKPGIINEKQNAPRTSRGDTVLAYVKPGEMLLNERQQMTIRQMAGNSIFDDAGVPGASRSTTAVPYFASGGVVDFTPQTTFASGGAGGQSLNAQATFSEGQIRSLANVLAGTIADTVAVEVRKALALGLDDSTRRLEREQNLTVQREG